MTGTVQVAWRMAHGVSHVALHLPPMVGAASHLGIRWLTCSLVQRWEDVPVVEIGRQCMPWTMPSNNTTVAAGLDVHCLSPALL